MSDHLYWQKKTIDVNFSFSRNFLSTDCVRVEKNRLKQILGINNLNSIYNMAAILKPSWLLIFSAVWDKHPKWFFDRALCVKYKLTFWSKTM